MTTAHRDYQQSYYDRTYPRRAAAVRDQLAHPLFRSFNDRLAGHILDRVAATRSSGPAGWGNSANSANGSSAHDPSTNGSRPAPLRIFETACGEGFLGAALLRVAKERGIEIGYSGADLSEGAVELSRPTLGDDLVVGDAAEVTAKMETGAVDVLIAKNLLHHLETPTDLLREAGRVVGPSGRVVIVEARLGSPHFMLLGALAPRREKFYFFGARRNQAAVAAAGLTILDRRRFSFLPYELFFQSRFGIMRKKFSTSDPRAIGRYTKLDDRLARALPWFASYWVWVAAPTAPPP
ncbi:MAG TPA: methyltransferase domain-containing protein [Acidimicrobiales bacterium]|nr:methyltransferase domain-containing protein [Acidimicrobiales bacterium]